MVKGDFEGFIQGCDVQALFVVKGIFELQGVAIIAYQRRLNLAFVESGDESINPSGKTSDDPDQERENGERNLSIDDLREQQEIGYEIAKEKKHAIVGLVHEDPELGFGFQNENFVGERFVDFVEPRLHPISSDILGIFEISGVFCQRGTKRIVLLIFALGACHERLGPLSPKGAGDDHCDHDGQYPRDINGADGGV